MADPPESSAKPFLAVAAAIAILSLMDAVIKTFGPSVPTVQIVFLRYAFGALWALPVYLATGPHPVLRANLGANLQRTLAMLVAAGLFFYSITRMPLVEVVTLAFTAPLFMVLLARLLLGEPLERRSMAALALGFAGVVTIVAGGSGSGGALTPGGVAAILGSAAAYALGIVLLRKHSANERPPALVFTQQVIGVTLVAPIAALWWEPVVTDEWVRYGLVGAMATTGSLMMAWGFARAAAGRLAPLEYTNLLWATIFAYAWFNEHPTLPTFAGGAAIVGACLLAARRGWPVFPRRRWLAPWRRRSP